MAASPPDADPAKAGPQTKPPNETWGMRRNPRNSAPLRLISALRGQGTLTWSGGSVSAAYELDLFDRGAVHLASGNLEGDFSSLMAKDDGAAAQAGGGRLRLDDGREVDIVLISLDPAGADFEANGDVLAANLAP